MSGIPPLSGNVIPKFPVKQSDKSSRTPNAPMSGDVIPKFPVNPSDKTSMTPNVPMSGLVSPKPNKSPKTPIIISSLVLSACALVKLIADKVKGKKI